MTIPQNYLSWLARLLLSVGSRVIQRAARRVSAASIHWLNVCVHQQMRMPWCINFFVQLHWGWENFLPESAECSIPVFQLVGLQYVQANAEDYGPWTSHAKYPCFCVHSKWWYVLPTTLRSSYCGGRRIRLRTTA